ncbi:30S ribosomal protein S6e [Candidatus Bathyarchaeota archaeon]|nr:30S ribosomal protein S6e [Candidatus Bathyarchaeota archaeon]
MPKFKLVISDVGTGKSQTLEIDDVKGQVMIGRRIGDTVDGSVVDMKGRELLITGGSDKDGFPMRRNIHGGIRIGVILSDGPGFHPKNRGERKRKKVRGDTITEDISQINMKVLRTPKKETKTKRGIKKAKTAKKKETRSKKRT